MSTSQTIDSFIKYNVELELTPKGKADIDKIWESLGAIGIDTILSACNLSDDFNINIRNYTYTINIGWWIGYEELQINYIPIVGECKSPAISLSYNTMDGDCYFVLKWDLDRVNLVEELPDVLRRIIKCMLEIMEKNKISEVDKNS